jgi:hypothetical protein
VRSIGSRATIPSIRRLTSVRELAAQLPNAAVMRPSDGPELKLLCHLRRDGVTSVAVHFFQRCLSGAATAAPRRFVARVAARS